MSYIGTGVPNRALTSADIAQGAVTLDDISFTDQPTNLNILGTIDKHTMRLTDGVTVTGDVTLSDNLIFSKLSDDGNAITLTDDGSTRTITGTGSIEASTLAQTPNSSLTGMTGTLGAGVFPAGHILQVQTVNHTGTTQIASGGALHELTSNLRISFTPISDSSRLVFNFQSSFCFPNSNQLQWAYFYDVTNTAVVNEPPAAGSRKRVHWANRTTPNDANDFDDINMTTSVANNNKTLRVYTVYHGTEGNSAQFLVSTLSSSGGFVAPMDFTITEIQV